MATEERRNAAEGEEVVYKTKVVQFLGRSTPIVLQNDNGPCPLLAICNVLLLRNSLNLSLDASEVSLQKLLSLVAERVIDSNSNLQDKDDGYAINQQQNIADAIDLLPRLATGIDVNVQFRKINDFEFTRECAIFDLLDIGLYHGWIVDPQDTDTAAAIGSNSYNTLVGELVAFETRKSGEEDDSVDFAAATTAALGVPSPCLSRGRSFDDSSVTVPAEQGSRKGDKEESEELIRALNLSKAEVSSSVDESMSNDAKSSHVWEGSTHIESSGSGIHADSLVAQIVDEKSEQSELLSAPQDCNPSSRDNSLCPNVSSKEDNALLPNNNAVHNTDKPESETSGVFLNSSASIENVRTDTMIQTWAPSFHSTDGGGSDGCYAYNHETFASTEDQSATQTYIKDGSTAQIPQKLSDNMINCESSSAACEEFHPSNGENKLPDDSEIVYPSRDDREPIYEGEECILDPRHTKYEDQEPVYEGEMILAEQSDKTQEDTSCVNSGGKVSEQQCQLIKNFLENSASQLTIYGLFCLQEGLKERELCVFFRNNHFSTMFKFNGELYLLATDLGYINQPDLVWEKLNEVNGDTVFMTGNFTEFKIENQVNDSWNEQNAMSSTADYLATLEGSTPASSSFNSDLQLAIALQQQEFDQQPQPQRPPQQSSQQAPVSGRSRLVTGPQVSRSSHAPQKSESKSKEKCTIM